MFHLIFRSDVNWIMFELGPVGKQKIRFIFPPWATQLRLGSRECNISVMMLPPTHTIEIENIWKLVCKYYFITCRVQLEVFWRQTCKYLPSNNNNYILLWWAADHCLVWLNPSKWHHTFTMLLSISHWDQNTNILEICSVWQSNIAWFKCNNFVVLLLLFVTKRV